MKTKVVLIFCLALALSGCYFSNTPLLLNESGFHRAEDSPFLALGEEVTGLASDGVQVVAVGGGGTIAFSPDSGKSWIKIPEKSQAGDDINVAKVFPGYPILFKAITWGGGYFLAAGDGGRAAYSGDGLNWEAGIIGPMSPKDIHCVAAGKMLGSLVFTAAGKDGRMAFAAGSPQGPWYMADQTPFGTVEGFGDTVTCLSFGVIQGSGVFVAGGTRGRIAIMQDLSGKWYGGRAGTGETFRSIAFGNDRFVAVGDNGLIKISANPRNYNWTSGPVNPFENRTFPGIAFHPLIKHFVVFTGDAALGLSEFGEDWNATAFSNHFPAESVSAISCSASRIILGGSQGSILYSN
jgi:hypothetical protein